MIWKNKNHQLNNSTVYQNWNDNSISFLIIGRIHKAKTSLSQFSLKIQIEHLFMGFMFNIAFMLGTSCRTNALL